MTNQTQKTIGLLFGSFNPVHTGHLVIADHFVQYTDIECIWFVLSPQNPFKTNEEMLDQDKRLELLELAIEGNEHFEACDIELKMGTPSYTILTIKKLQADFPGHRFILIIGSDNLDDFDKWKDYEELLSLVNIYVYPRPGHSGSRFLSHPAVKLVEAPRIDISSTQIRRAISEGKSPRYLLPDKVLQRIITKNYY